MYCEDDLLPISALQHLMFCERRCALVHLEQQWEENYFTAQGRIIHEKAHSEQQDRRGDLRIERGMALKSSRLGLIGKADVVEFHLKEGNVWIPFPIEYKRGRKVADDFYRVQLCAQALCLEEMLNLGFALSEGAIFYGKTRRRENVLFDETLRSKTILACEELHALIDSGVTPKAEYCEKCDQCSLNEICLPKIFASKTIEEYLKRMVSEYEETS
ncbi:MAG: CRISPR-associated protein Cas4 [Candidatus Omnitrophica bacterium]|nr:CRISPR-associated protein Cas4 [Candidatus Omnitrophota bacterium]